MSKLTVTCPICSATFKRKQTDPILTNCPGCYADLLHPGVEVLQHKTSSNYVKSAMNVQQGFLILTDKRLIQIRNDINPMAYAGGLVGAAIATSMNKDQGQAIMSVPLENILKIEETKKGIRSSITIQTRDGESYHLIPSKLKQWKELLSMYMTS